jgi:hypothetical protein
MASTCIPLNSRHWLSPLITSEMVLPLQRDSTSELSMRSVQMSTLIEIQSSLCLKLPDFRGEIEVD